jgi:hypothetical protein
MAARKRCARWPVTDWSAVSEAVSRKTIIGLMAGDYCALLQDSEEYTRELVKNRLGNRF